MPVLNPDALVTDRVQAIRTAHESTGITKAEVDLSGGIDSAVILGLVANAIGPENVIAVHSGINSNPDALRRAQLVADTFGVKLCYIDLTTIYEDLVRETMTAMANAGYDTTEAHKRMQADKTVLGSIRSTLRAPVGRGFNRIFGGGLRHGTGNECEDRWLRFYQKGGDGEVDSNPIAMLSKGEVYQLALALGVPTDVINARPSPDLWGEGDGHNDEDEIGDYLGFSAADYDQTFYSYIDTDTGAYTHVGLIERVSRFLDTGYAPVNVPGVTIEDRLFGDDFNRVSDRVRDLAYDFFPDLNLDLVNQLLTSARRVERITRHKMNPNCPAYGDRKTLVDAGILTNELPKL